MQKCPNKKRFCKMPQSIWIGSNWNPTNPSPPIVCLTSQTLDLLPKDQVTMWRQYQLKWIEISKEIATFIRTEIWQKLTGLPERIPEAPPPPVRVRIEHRWYNSIWIYPSPTSPTLHFTILLKLSCKAIINLCSNKWSHSNPNCVFQLRLTRTN